MPKDYKSIENKTDIILNFIKKSKWSAVIVAAFWLSGYFAGYYVGDVFHWIGQLF